MTIGEGSNCHLCQGMLPCQMYVVTCKPELLTNLRVMILDLPHWAVLQEQDPGIT